MNFKRAVIILITIIFSINFISCQKTTDYSKEYKPLTDAWFEAWNTGYLDKLDTVLDPEIEHSTWHQPFDFTGIETFKNWVTNGRKALPDFNAKIEEEIFLAGKAIIRAKWTATNTGPYSYITKNSGSGTISPTGKRITNNSTFIFYIKNGKIYKEWFIQDDFTVFEQLGFTLTPPTNMKQIAETWQNTYNTHDVKAFVELFTDDIIYGNASSEPLKRKKIVTETFTNTFNTFPEIRIDIKQIFSLGSYIACQHEVTGTFKNTWKRPDGDVAPNGKTAVMPMISLIKVTPDGLISEVRDYYDTADLMKQLGVEQ